MELFSMTIAIDVEAEVKQAMMFYKRTGRRAVLHAASEAINKVAATTNTAAKKAITDHITGKTLPKYKLTRYMKVYNSHWQRLRAKLSAFSLKRRSMNLIEFMTKAKRDPAYWRKRRDTGKKSYRSGVESNAWDKKRTYPGTFVVRGRNSGKPLVFTRAEGTRHKLKYIFGPSVRMMFGSKTVMPRAMKKAQERWPIEWERSFNFRVGFRKRGRAL